MFVIDVSVSAVASGALQVAVDTIRAQLDSLPGAPRTRVGFLTYDNSIHFYNLKVRERSTPRPCLPISHALLSFWYCSRRSRRRR